MAQAEQRDVLILGSGQAGALMAWHMARSGRKRAMVEGLGPLFATVPAR